MINGQDLKSFRQERLAFYSEMYWKEFDLKNEITANMPIVIGVLTLIFAAVGYLWKGFEFPANIKCDREGITCLFILSAVATVVFGSIAAVWTARALLSRSYDHVPSPESIESYLTELRDYYSETNETQIDEKLHSDFEEMAITYYVSCTSTNRQTNIVKSAYRFKGQLFSVIALLALLFGFVLFLLQNGFR